MKKWRGVLKTLIVLLSLLLVFPGGMLNAAAVKAGIDHNKPGDTYIPGFRINLEASVKDPAGLLTTRCYFRAKKDKNFGFVSMTTSGDGTYKAILPAPFVGSEEVHYLFVSVNAAKKVNRTKVFILEEEETKEGIKWKDVSEIHEVRLDRIQEAAEKFVTIYDQAKSAYANKLPNYQVPSPKGSIQVGSELPVNDVPMKGFSDQASVTEVPDNLKYGLSEKGIYEPEGVSTKAIVGLAVVAGGAAAIAASGGGSDGGGSVAPPPGPGGGLTTADLTATWSIQGATSDWHSASIGPYVFSGGGTWSGLASSPTGPQSVSGTWSFDETTQALTMQETTAGYSATISSGVISGTASSFTVNGVLPLIPYTNNFGVSYPSQAPDTFTFTKQ